MSKQTYTVSEETHGFIINESNTRDYREVGRYAYSTLDEMLAGLRELMVKVDPKQPPAPAVLDVNPPWVPQYANKEN